MSRIIPVEVFGDDDDLMEIGRRPRRGRGRNRGGRRMMMRRRLSQQEEQPRRRRQEEEEEQPRRRRQEEEEEQPRRGMMRRQQEDDGGQAQASFAGVRRKPAPSWFSGDNYFGGEDNTGAFKWPSWLKKKKKPATTAAGPNLAVVAKPGAEMQAGVITLKPGLYLVAEVPTTAGDAEFGFLPFLVPMAVRAAKRALSDNSVEQEGKPARGFNLFRKQNRDHDPEQTTAIARRNDAAEAPRWVDEHDAAEVGFGWMEG